ncbi:MAG: DinB family protein [Candidatus Obscuribacterales bacterium]|nr:DinB family protein [Candidatus Obscuribacterales bacterium]
MTQATSNFSYSNAFRSAWSFTRSLTTDLLHEMSDSDLLFLPGPQLGPFWKQFRHVGRVQECYIEALSTRSIDFTPDGKSYDQGPSKEWLQDYLQRLDVGLFEIIDNLDWESEIDWFGEKVNIFEHMMRMESHETLHHGQWIVYMRLMNKQVPDSWVAWGL